MAKNGFKLIDAEMHVMEPVDLWQRYIDPEFKARAPRRLDERRWDIRTVVEGEVMAAILFPTSAMYVTAFTRMDPRFAAAVCRAYNDWLHDYIEATDPKRMFGAAAVSPHEVESAIAETRRAVTQLGMKAIFLRP